ncbi:hypothetical protein QBC37DRAFT_171200 [Rhypophila decipiens]|uniref:Uncharacterized protein n=1 Tax=Rhypophila decipiens TaxID=261697 RepID=A0AAN6Y6F3_9PEZI|nr:hypothetical protein QBC37DRAFT_171200 [Rhypophila decipiens]
MLEKTQPSTWFVSEKEEVFPYEFHYSADGDDTDEKEGAETPADSKYSGFVKAFTDLLRKKDALGLFGLGRYPGDDFEGRVEITEGRANINLRPQDAPKHLASRAAAWYFSPNLLGKCVCVCGGNGHTDATHQGHVATRK